MLEESYIVAEVRLELTSILLMRQGWNLLQSLRIERHVRIELTSLGWKPSIIAVILMTHCWNNRNRTYNLLGISEVL